MAAGVLLWAIAAGLGSRDASSIATFLRRQGKA